MIVITTPTGKIGSQVLQHLIAAHETVRVVARDASKLPPALVNQVDIVEGSLDNEAVMEQALEGAESLFLNVPPSFKANNDTEYYRRFTLPSCRAVQNQNVKRVIAVSALGRGFAVEAGPVTASLQKDEEIEKTGVDFRALWCPSFMDNMLGQLHSIKTEGRFFLPGTPDHKTRHVATKDIAASTSRLLLDRSWTGQGGLAVLGPEDLSFNDMALIMTDVLGKPIRFQRVTADAYRSQLVQHGGNETFADGLARMFVAKANGLDDAEPRTTENTTPTTFQDWCQMVLKPALEA